MLTNHRVLFKDNLTSRDISIKLNEYLSGSEVIAVVAAEDALYIGSDLPFNHRWIDVSVFNDLASSMSVKLWNGSTWKSAVDVIDQTSVAGVTLAQSGILSWTPDRNESWSSQLSTEDIPELSTFKIYDMYWAKIEFTADLKSTTAINYVGYKFSNDSELYGEYPELDNSTLRNSFKSGKLNWNDQAFIAAEYIIQDLRAMNVIWSRNQILNWPLFKSASVHKMAEIIFRSLGSEYEAELADSMKAYRSSLNMKMFQVDLNRNATLDEKEKRETVGFLRR